MRLDFVPYLAERALENVEKAGINLAGWAVLRQLKRLSDR